MRPKVGDLISGKYRLVRMIGDGGMGTVFEARHEYLGTAVALKFLHPELTQRTGLVARFLQEARLSAGIRSHHIAHVTDVDQGPGGEAYLVMELLRGESLQTVLDREKRLPLDTALDYTLQMLAGLDAAHAMGVVHRDLKPDNVFIVGTPRGPLVKLLDFGIAKLRSSEELAALTKPGTVMGTPEYMAPEQAYSSDTVDARADVYAAGAMLYEMVLGKRPAPGDDPQQIAAYVMGKNVVRMNRLDPSVPDGLADAVHRAMAPLASDRFPNVAAFRDALVPFARTLSLAGRLAATPAPPAASPGLVAQAEVSGVAPTLPPDDAGRELPPAPAPPPVHPQGHRDGVGLERAARAPHAPAANVDRTVPRGGATQAADPYQERPWGPAHEGARPWGATEAAGAPPYRPQPPPPPAPAVLPAAHHVSAIPAAPTRGRSRSARGGSMWLLVVMLLAALGIVAAVVCGLQTEPSSKPPESASVAAPTAITAPPTVAPTRASPAINATIAPPVQPPAALPAPRPATTARPATKGTTSADGGGASADAAAAPAPVGFPGLPQMPFPLPSALPFPLPSTLPFPLPSGLPPFTLPGFPQPAPVATP